MDAKGELDRLRAENAALKAAAQVQAAARLRLKVSAKGGLSLYGLGRFPVTLYREQWERVLGFAPSISDFIAGHVGELSLKADKPAAVPAEAAA
jgi:hypothetical protein